MDRLQIINSITNKDWDENDLHNYHFLIIAVEIAKKNLNRNNSAIETHFYIHFDVLSYTNSSNYRFRIIIRF